MMCCWIWTAPCLTGTSTISSLKKNCLDGMLTCHKLSFEAARDRLMGMYRSVEGELAWTDLHYWSERVGIDVIAMHQELQPYDRVPARRGIVLRGDLRQLGESASRSSQRMRMDPAWR